MSRTLYTALLYLLLPFTPLKLLWRARKQPEYLQHWQERYGCFKPISTKPVIWLHTVSVGETRAAAPLINKLLQQFPDHQIVLTHATPTGRAASLQLFGDTVIRTYLPYDLPFAVKRFLRHFKPAIGVLMETELWFNLIAQCRALHIPLLLANARLSEKSASGYQKLGKVALEGISHLTTIAAQTQPDAERLRNLGAKSITVTGNIKFDVTPTEGAAQQGYALRQQLGQQRPVFLAASTRDGEEEEILHAVVNANIPNLLTLIVPRHPQRFDAAAELLKRNALAFVRRSALGDHRVDSEISWVLGDSMGEMFTYYASCDVAFIGGSLMPLGGQNLIEACSMGIPVLVGPHTFNFEQATEMAIAAGAALRVQRSEELTDQLRLLFADSALQQKMSTAALRFSSENQGATDRILTLLTPYLKNTVDQEHTNNQANIIN